MSLVLHHSKATGTAKLVLLGIANHDGDGGAWPSVETLTRYANATRTTVQRAIRELERMGELATDRQAGGPAELDAWQRPNRYHVLVSCPITCDRTKNHRPRPLPQAQADLWIEGAAPVQPGGASAAGGAAPVQPGGAAPTQPKPSIEPSMNTTQLVSQPQTARARAAACTVCGLPEAECQRRIATSGHTYTPPTPDTHEDTES